MWMVRQGSMLAWVSLAFKIDCIYFRRKATKLRLALQWILQPTIPQLIQPYLPLQTIHTSKIYWHDQPLGTRPNGSIYTAMAGKICSILHLSPTMVSIHPRLLHQFKTHYLNTPHCTARIGAYCFDVELSTAHWRGKLAHHAIWWILPKRTVSSWCLLGCVHLGILQKSR